MKESKKTFWLAIIAFLFVVVIGIGLWTSRPQSAPLKRSATETLELLGKAEATISAQDARKILAEKSTRYRFIDLRDPAAFMQGHIDGALNIPMNSLMAPEYLTLFKDASTTYILYGNDPSYANGPWLTLQQAGFDNFKTLQGGYALFTNFPDSAYIAERPQFDYKKVFESEQAKLLSAAKATPSPSAPAKKAVIPKKKAVEKEQEEGC
ncbi:MAG: rhodanese-like domain-containing protein [Haliscomenobacter sp.]|nr:rhodanese-like domain-containing protein [Haliscomenobacter sp.]